MVVLEAVELMAEKVEQVLQEIMEVLAVGQDLTILHQEQKITDQV